MSLIKKDNILKIQNHIEDNTTKTDMETDLN